MEKLYALRMAKVCKCDESISKQLYDEENPCVIKRLSKKTKRTEYWNSISTAVLKDLVSLKFASHPRLLDKLLSYPGENFYECTRDPTYGCGYTLSKSHTVTVSKVKAGANTMGMILKEVRDCYKPK